MCHDKSYIDFTQFSSALIVGKVENNDLYSNGVGKTTIFKAIEYVLFNQSDSNLEKIIRDDATQCQVVFDFLIDDQEYRVSRIRTKKGTSDLTLLQRNAVGCDDFSAYHSDSNSPILNKDTVKKYWKDLSGSRAGDTEKDLSKLIKINPKSFRSTIHFLQNDLTGLPTATPEKRKGILKEALNLAIYTKLEKIAKDKSSSILKEIEKNKVLLDAIGDPQKEISEISIKIKDAKSILKERGLSLNLLNDELKSYNERVNELNNLHSSLEKKFVELFDQEKSLKLEKNKNEISVKEYQSKKTNVAKVASDLVVEIKALKEVSEELSKINYDDETALLDKVSELKEKLAHNNVVIKNNIDIYEDLKIPLPSGSVCKNCRKPMSDKDRQDHKVHISNEMLECQNKIKDAKQEINNLNSQILKIQSDINLLKSKKKKLEDVNSLIDAKTKEYKDKKSLHEEYTRLFKKFEQDLKDKCVELSFVSEKLKLSSAAEADVVAKQIEDEKGKLSDVINKISMLNKDITHHSSSKAIMEHVVNEKSKDLDKKKEISVSLLELETKFKMYPSVLEAFSSAGIPNLIIQNVLDDLQIESNNLLSQLKPGLQLQFEIEKTVEKTGDQADTLDIIYNINGKERYYEQLSGAQKLAVTFSLKLGLSFLLQKMIGTDIKFLLLDEIDQSLDKASVDAFADIVKFFQKDFTILIITHNDRLKDKFSHAILVEQDISMVSRAKVVSNW
jgi:DNA repair exonuclease SbcCD ATPase subunit